MVMEEEQSHMELASESVPVPQVIITNELMEDEVNNVEIATPKKKPRLRKKALHAAIRKQMEFYFGDSNLSKDRFLGNLIKQDPYVELSVFLRFNKIRTLTTDLKQIVKALQKSEMLSVSEDGSRVCRVTPISQKDNIDECTVYVQRLPLNADHEWLSTVFSQYGQVAYVSIPRYKSNKKIKGFAFVEFEEVSSAIKCIEGFREKSCVLPSQTSPDSLLSITTFHEEEMMEKKQRKERYEETVQKREARGANEVKTEDGGKGETKIGKKRRHEESEVSEADSGSTTEKKQKKSKQKGVKETTEEEELGVEMKEEDKGGDSNEDNADSDKEKKSKKRKQRSLSSTKTLEETEPVAEKENCSENENKNLENDEVFTEDEILGEHNQKRKRKRKRTNRGEKVDTADIGMQIMAKKDWKTLRNKYLELQRSKMKSLKAHLKRARWNQWNNYEKFRESDKSKAPKEEVKENSDDKKDEKSKERFVFTPGVIVRVEMDEPCTDPKSFKTELKRNTSIKYIDVSEGANEAFLRCNTNEAAKALVLQSNEDRTMSILQDNEETQYWNKISKDREDKLGKKVRVKQRGRDKLLKKAEKELGKHIKFDEV